MIGRNDPCHCGSGKKYKKCHGKNADGNVQQLITDELNRIERSFIQEVNPAANPQINQRYQKFFAELGKVFPDFLINAINIETFVYIDEAAHWQEYIAKEAESNMRSQVKEIIENWQNPRFILAHVESYDAQQITILDLVNNETYQIAGTAEGNTPGEWIFGIALPDSRQGENGLLVKSSSLFIPKTDEPAKDEILTLLKSGVTDSFELYKTFAHSALATPEGEEEIPVAAETAKVEEAPVVKEAQPASEELSYNDEVIAAVNKYVAEFNLDATTFLTKLNDFLSTEAVKAKKPETVAASAILAAQATNNLPEGGLSKVKDVAEYYEVSSSSLAKYRKQITEFLEN